MPKEYSGNIKLRLPKILHEKLVESAQYEGISLNQYCVYLLSEKLEPYFLGRRKLNSELISIRDNVGTTDLKGLVNNLKPLTKKVIKLRPLLTDYLKSNTNLNIQDEADLELRYPVLVSRHSEGFNLELKIPTIKLVFKPINYNYTINNNLINLLKENLNDYPFAALTLVNIDELNYNMSPNLSNEDLNSIVIYFLTEDLDEITETISKLTQATSNYSDNYSINYYPVYFLNYLN